MSGIAVEHGRADHSQKKDQGCRVRPTARLASAVRESVPPSPLLSARNRISTYLIVTVIISAHRIIDRTPSTATGRYRTMANRRRKRFAERIERAGADIAVDDPDAPDR